MPQTLNEVSIDDLLDLSFYNFSNAITACFFCCPNLKLLKVNSVFNEFCGKTENWSGSPLSQVLRNLGIQEVDLIRFQAQLKEQGQAKLQQIELVQCGQTKYYSLFATYTSFPGYPQLNGFQGQLIDRTQEVLLQKREESLANQIRHDMKNRIHLITTHNASLSLQKELLAASSPLPAAPWDDYLNKLDQGLKDINKSSNFLSDMVAQILDVNKLHEGKLKLSLKPFTLEEVFTEVSQALEPQRQARGLTLKLQASGVKVIADRLQITRVMENYISNAFKYAVSKVFVKTAIEDEKAQLIVQDDGVGLHPNDLERVFDPFYQVEGQARAGSTGLGLDAVRQLIQLHGGECWAESKGLGQGSLFGFRIPLQVAG